MEISESQDYLSFVHVIRFLELPLSPSREYF